MVFRSVQVLMLTVFASLPMLGQGEGTEEGSNFWLGPVIEGRFGIDVGSVPVYAGSFDCGEFSSGHSFAVSIGDVIFLPTLFSERAGLQSAISFSFASGTLSTDPIDPIRRLDTETGELVDVDQEYRLNATTASAMFDLQGTLRFSNRIGVGFGGFISTRLSSDITQTEHILAPDNIRLSNGLKENEMPGGTRPEAKRIGFGPLLSATYSLPLGERSRVVSGLVIRPDVATGLQEYSWRRIGIGLSAAVLFNLSPKEPPPPAERPSPGEAPDDVPESPPLLTASIRMVGVNDRGEEIPSARIDVFETFYRRHVPLIPAAFFEEGRSELPERYVRLDRDRIEDFAPGDLVETDEVGIQQQILNVVGRRLVERRDATITLAGSSSRGEDPGLGRKRAESVRQYLIDVWGIPTGRIGIADRGRDMERSSEETEEGRGDNRRVEIVSSDARILGPVVTTRIVREFNPPLIRLKSDFDAEKGVRKWRLVITQAGSELATYGSDVPDAGGEMNWHILQERLDQDLSPLHAVLTVEDSTGATVSSESDLPIALVKRPRVVDRRVEQRGDRERLAWSLVGFGFSSAVVDRRNESVLHEVAGIVRENAEVTVTGYTDRIGDRERNRQLAIERATNVATLLKGTLKGMGTEGVRVTVEGGGMETERFDNDLPEGRALARGVEIVVQQKSQ